MCIQNYSNLLLETNMSFECILGLDSYQATQVIETLRKLADQCKTIIAVIHQPSQHTFQLFDDLLLVSEGKLMYYGEGELKTMSPTIDSSTFV